MTAALFLLDAGRLAGATPGQTIVVDGAEGRHAATVKRIEPGEPVLLADGSGVVAECETVAADADRLEVRIVAVREEHPGRPRVTLVQALAKGDRDDQAIEAATELGVDRIVPWQAERSIVQWRGERGAKARRKWEQVVRAAAKQSRRATVPVVAELLDRKRLASLADANANANVVLLVLHEDADEALAGLDLSAADEVVLVVGPEGGISPAELDALRDVGARVVRLGPHVLRASSAGPAAISVVMAATRWTQQPAADD